MAKDVTICVGTLGQGIWRTGDGGNSWARIRKGIYGECAVRALAVHPRDSRVMYAGTDVGIYRSETRGEGWEMLDSPMNEMQIGSIAIDPVDPDIIFAGTRPGALFRTKDGGLKWDSLSVEIAEECPAVLIPRVTALVVDPVDHNNVWAGMEVDGVRRSRDGGDTWELVTNGVTDPDIHSMTITVGPPKTLLTVTPREVFSSTDDGDTWQPVGAGKQVSIPHCRIVAVKQDDPQVVYMGNGESAFSGQGALHRSRDRGTRRPGSSCPPRRSSTGRYGISPLIPRTPASCWPAPSTERCTPARMRATLGPNSPGNSARSRDWPGCLTNAGRLSVPGPPRRNDGAQMDTAPSTRDLVNSWAA